MHSVSLLSVHLFLVYLYFLLMSVYLPNEWQLRRRLRLNVFAIAAPSPFPFRFRLNDGFVAGFDCMHSVSPLPIHFFLVYLYFLLTHSLPETVSVYLPNEWQLRRRIRLNVFAIAAPSPFPFPFPFRFRLNDGFVQVITERPRCGSTEQNV
jgi:hypothetical protein